MIQVVNDKVGLSTKLEQMVWLWIEGVFTFQYDMGPKQIRGTNVKFAK
jgi:hypothetical protein